MSFGDDVALVERHTKAIDQTTGRADVAARTGAKLVDFVAAGAHETPGRLRYPASYLVTNGYFDADVAKQLPAIPMMAAVRRASGEREMVWVAVGGAGAKGQNRVGSERIPRLEHGNSRVVCAVL